MICSNLKSIEELFYAQYHCQHIPSQLNKSPFHLISDIKPHIKLFPKDVQTVVTLNDGQGVMEALSL